MEKRRGPEGAVSGGVGKETWERRRPADEAGLRHPLYFAESAVWSPDCLVVLPTDSGAIVVGVLRMRMP